MDWETFGQMAVALLAFGAALLQYQRSRSDPREQIRRDVELLKILPDGDTRSRLLVHVGSSVEKLIARETELRRDPAGIVLGVIFMAGAVMAGYFAATASLPWSVVLWVAAAFLGILGLVGFVQDVVPRKRDEKGRPV